MSAISRICFDIMYYCHPPDVLSYHLIDPKRSSCPQWEKSTFSRALVFVAHEIRDLFVLGLLCGRFIFLLPLAKPVLLCCVNPCMQTTKLTHAILQARDVQLKLAFV